MKEKEIGQKLGGITVAELMAGKLDKVPLTARLALLALAAKHSKCEVVEIVFKVVERKA